MIATSRPLGVGLGDLCPLKMPLWGCWPLEDPPGERAGLVMRPAEG